MMLNMKILQVNLTQNFIPRILKIKHINSRFGIFKSINYLHFALSKKSLFFNCWIIFLAFIIICFVYINNNCSVNQWSLWCLFQSCWKQLNSRKSMKLLFVIPFGKFYTFHYWLVVRGYFCLFLSFSKALSCRDFLTNIQMNIRFSHLFVFLSIYKLHWRIKSDFMWF